MARPQSAAAWLERKPLESLCKVDGDIPDWFRSGMEAAMLAPTARNQQKFLFTLSGDMVKAESIGGSFSNIDLGAEEIAAAEAANPDVEHLYVYLTEDAPECGEIERIVIGYDGPDNLRAGCREIYLLCHQSVRDSKLAAALGKLDTPMTARNWKTINKLCEMLSE